MHRTGLAWTVAAGFLLVACARPRADRGLPLPSIQPGYEETGLATWNGEPYHGRLTASGEVYDMNQMTAAHRTLPFGTRLAVENLDNGRRAEVRVNDRGPFVDGRILDLSYAAGRALGAIGPGVIPVRLRVSATPPAATTTPARAFTLQLGAFSEAEHAVVFQRELVDRGVDARVEEAAAGVRRLYRVRVGHFPSRGEAAEEARRLVTLGYAPFVLEE